MKIKITGINGYIGQLIAKRLKDKNHDVSGIKRNLLYGASKNLEDEIKGCDIIINLAGAPILQRWTEKNKREIYNSRVETSNKLILAIVNLAPEERPKKVISASAIGIYEAGKLHNEQSNDFDSGFLGEVVRNWEATFENLPHTVQKNIFRIGLVLGKEAKIIKNLLLPFKMGLGGKIGSGKQAFPFIHEKDLVKAFCWAVEELEESGTFNLVAPQQLTNAGFTKVLAKKLKRPAFLPVPSFIIKLVLGKAAVLLLKSPAVSPLALQERNFVFTYPTITSTLEEIINIKKSM